MMAQGMFGITPQLEAEGRKGDTEVGMISKGSVVIPVALMQSEDGKELMKALRPAYMQNKLNIKQFTVSPNNESYADSEDAVQAHLTNGELVIPPSVLSLSPDLYESLRPIFKAGDTTIETYTVGNESNNINPETGLPEFGFFSKVWKAVTSPIKAVAKVVEKVIDPVVKLGENIVNGIGDALEGVVDLADEAIQNPYVRAAISVIYPPAAPYINAYAKLDSGESLTAGDIASLGLSAASDFTSFTIDPNVTKAITTGAKIADGADPLSTLVGTYGADFVDQLGLQDTINTQLSDTFGADTASWLTDRMDLNQLGADLIAGTDPNRMIANQFGDDIANYIGSGDPNLTALGYAGIETGIALDNGEDQANALMAGAKEYYDQGGQLPDIGQLADLTGLDVNQFDWNQYLPEIGFQAPEFLAQGYDWLKNQNIDLGNIDFGGFNVPDLNMDLGQFADLGGNFGDLNWEGVDWQGTGYSLDELKNMGVDLGKLNMGDLTLPQALGLAGVAGQLAQEGAPEEDIVASLENPLLKPKDEGPLFSRQILESTPIV